MIGRRQLRLVEVFKHDSWACTTLYQDGRERFVVKFNRVQPILGLSMHWLGRWLARHEDAVLQRLAGLPNIPRSVGPVFVRGQKLDHAAAREYIPGRPLRRRDALQPAFALRFDALLQRLHARNVAYVDLHKRENLLVGDNGMPYLIDFQVSFLLPTGRWARFTPLPWLLRLLQDGDRYHWRKHRRRLIPGQAADLQRPGWIRLHRLIARPLRQARRRLLAALRIRGQTGRAATELFPEAAIRQELAASQAA
jgi:hypothetical protein